MTVPLIIAVTVEPTTKGDEDKLRRTLRRLTEADPHFDFASIIEQVRRSSTASASRISSTSST